MLLIFLVFGAAFGGACGDDCSDSACQNVSMCFDDVDCFWNSENNTCDVQITCGGDVCSTCFSNGACWTKPACAFNLHYFKCFDADLECAVADNCSTCMNNNTCTLNSECFWKESYFDYCINSTVSCIQAYNCSTCLTQTACIAQDTLAYPIKCMFSDHCYDPTEECAGDACETCETKTACNLKGCRTNVEGKCYDQNTSCRGPACSDCSAQAACEANSADCFWFVFNSSFDGNLVQICQDYNTNCTGFGNCSSCVTPGACATEEVIGCAWLNDSCLDTYTCTRDECESCESAVACLRREQCDWGDSGCILGKTGKKKNLMMVWIGVAAVGVVVGIIIVIIVVVVVCRRKGSAKYGNNYQDIQS